MPQIAVVAYDALALSLPGAGTRDKNPAIRGLDRPGLTYAELIALVRNVGNQLRAAGITSRDRVVLWAANSPEAATAFLAIANACQCVPLNPAHTDIELLDHLTELGAKLVVHTGATAPAAAVALKIPTASIHVDASAPAGMFSLPQLPAGNPALPVDAPTTALLLQTSGTSSRPKLVPLSWDNLRASASNIGTTLQLTPDDCCLNVLPLFHVAGLVSSLLATLQSGGTVVCTPGFVAPRFFEWLDEFAPTWFTAVPAIHHAIVNRAPAHPESLRRSRLRLIRSLSAPLSEALQLKLEETFGVPVVNAYGMTEGAGQLASTGLPPAIRKPGSIGQAAGPELVILDANGSVLPAGHDGEIWVRGANITSGYADNVAANREAFRNGWLRTGDLGRIDADGCLFLSGRARELINRAGEKISPYEIEAALDEHPAVEQCASFALPDSRLGEEVGALVAIRAGASVDEVTLQQFAAERLAAFKVPRRVFFVAEIPKTHNGKVRRVGLASWLGVTTDSWKLRDQAMSDDDALTAAVARLMAEVLGVAEVEPDVAFFDAGGDSLLAAQLLVRIESDLGKRLSMVDLFNRPSARAVAAKLTTGEVRRPAVAKEDTRAAATPLLCLAAGPIFRPMAQALGGRFESVPTPSSDTETINTMEELAARVVPTIQEAHPDGPLIIAGWSLAGVVAVEVAAQLERAGRDVQRVILFDSMCPVRQRQWFAPSPRLRQLQLDLIKAEYHIEEAWMRGPAEGLRYLARTVFDAHSRRHYDQLLRNAASGETSEFDVPLDFKYAFGRYAACYTPAPLRARVLFVQPERRKRGVLFSGDLGWAELGYQVDVTTVPGDHDRMFAPNNAPVLAERLLEVLGR